MKQRKPQISEDHFWLRQPRAAKAMISVFVLPPMAGALVGLVFSKFMPTPLGVKLGLIVGAIVGLAWVILAEVAVGTSNPDSLLIQTPKSNKLLRYGVIRGPLMWGFGMMIGYTATAWGYPWLLNMVFAQPSQRVVDVAGWFFGDHRSCQHPDIGQGFFVNSPRSLCVSWDTPALRKGSQLRIVGRSSIFGINVEELYPVVSPQYPADNFPPLRSAGVN